MSDSREKNTQQKAADGAARRKFIFDLAGTTCGVGLLGLGIGGYSTSANSIQSQALRPPGALPERDFPGACIRCGICVDDCPYDILKLARVRDEVPTGTPYFNALTGPCEMCEDIPCVQNCPTSALDSDMQDINDARMGLAVVVDKETCIAFLGLRCEICFNYRHNSRSGRHAKFVPVVHSDACTGCGLCEKACILEDAPAIKVLPIELAQGDLGHHYRVGWDQQEDAPGSLASPEETHQYNLPEGVRYEHHGEGLVVDEGGNPIVEVPEPPGSDTVPAEKDPLKILNKGLQEAK